MSKIEQIRTWLQNNKIFFELATALLVGAASLMVSWAALQVSERTLAATEVSALPHFAISKRARRDPATGKLIEETIVLNNYGAPVSNLSWTVRTFLVFDRYSPIRADVYIPLIAYYFAQVRTASPTGELSRIVGHENLRKFGDMYEEALQSKEKHADFGAYPTLLTVSKVSYKDRLGRGAITYFREYAQVDEAEVKPLLDWAEKAQGIDIDNVELAVVMSALRGPDALTVPKKK